jgi:FkbM family methyltransferase
MLATAAIRVAAIARARVPDYLYVAARAQVERVLHLQELELAYLTRHSARTSLRRFVDVGANWGSYSLLLAPQFTHVDAFEPVERCANALARYSETFGGSIRVHQCALSDREGTVPFFIPWRDDVDASSSSRVVSAGDPAAISVQAKTLDSFEFTDVDLIKIDVEGHEREVLRGAEETIRRCRPRLLVEVEQRHIDEPFANRIAAIEGLGYRATFVRDGSLAPMAELDLARDQDPTNIGRARYVNNFFFDPLRT